MISVRQLAAALYGLWLLIRFELRAWDFFDKSPRGFWTSFIVAVVLAPLQLMHFALSYDMDKASLDFVPYMVVQALTYVLGWVLFPFVMLYIARLLNRGPRYLWHMVPYNWMQLLWLPQWTAILFVDLQMLPDAVLNLIGSVSLVAFVVYGTFIAGIGLQVATGTALSLVVLDYVVSQIMLQLISRI
jgi:hypothetical protein